MNELLAKRPRLKLVLLSYGAHDLVEHLATEVGGRVKRDFAQVVDFWHLVEKLAGITEPPAAPGFEHGAYGLARGTRLDGDPNPSIENLDDHVASLGDGRPH